jgi:phage tail sheath protein FI|tara:strand:+ start:5881 stop:7557 length:1677 start_codon:yes stop_codon:yes gene_type:complete
MAFQVSPGVQVKEIDASGVVPAVSTSIGGFAGSFNWGPVDTIVTVSSEKELAETFGAPDSSTFKYFLTAASFLKYGNALKVVRVLTGHDNATAQGGGLLIKNKDHYDTLTGLSQGAWAAKYPGAKGNSLKVSVCPANATAWAGWAYASSFQGQPGTSEYATNLGQTSANDELHAVVIDEDGAWTGTAGTVLETFEYLSQGSDAKKADGTSNYYKDVINNNSQYAWWIGVPTGLTNSGATVAATASFAAPTAAVTNSLSGATDDNLPTVGEIAVGFDHFEDAETVEVNLLFAYPDVNAANDISNDIISIAVARKDCMAFVSPPIEDTVGTSSPAADVKVWADTLTSTSYASADSTAVYVYDKYNDEYRWIGAAGHTAGLCANTDNVADAWFSPAGVNRGQILGITKLAFNPKKADRDSLYKARVNPIVSLPGQGTMLFGDKTLLSRPSAFDRINVRRLFIVLEKAISTAAKAQLFEFNDEFTRAQFRNIIEPFLRDVKGRRGVTDFSVICDTTNNTGQVIDTNGFVADIYIKPARSINFITLNFVATRTGVDFSEISGV